MSGNEIALELHYPRSHFYTYKNSDLNYTVSTPYKLSDKQLKNNCTDLLNRCIVFQVDGNKINLGNENYLIINYIRDKSCIQKIRAVKNWTLDTKIQAIIPFLDSDE